MLRFPARSWWWLPLVLLLPVPLESQPLQWAWIPQRVATAPGPALLAPCGRLGTFAFLTSTTSWGNTLGVSTPWIEYPEPYPTPGSSPFSVSQVDLMSSVFPPPGTVRSHWVALVDFRGWHSASVAVAIRQYSGGAGEVFPYYLDDPAVTSKLGTAVTDAHVLVKLCRVFDDIDFGGQPAPAAVNLSFGRLAKVEDPESSVTCNADQLACQIAKVLAGLSIVGQGTGAPTALVSAAGNHGHWLFPAVLDEVLAAGLPDLLQSTDVLPVASWETPAPGRSLLLAPGAGLCLISGNLAWTAPAGSSFSTALVSAWLLEIPAHDRLGMIAGSFLDGDSRLRLAQGTSALAGAWVTSLEARKATAAPRCQAAALPTAQVPMRMTAVLAGLPSVPSLPELVESSHRPAPEPTPCVPCKDIRVPPPSFTFSALRSTTTGLGLDALGAEIELSSPWPLPQGVELVDLYLRVDGNFYRLAVDGGARVGLTQPLTLKIPWSGYAPVGQPSVLFVVRRGSDTYWNSVPILPGPGAAP